MVNQELELKNKLHIPGFPTDISSEIFGRMIQSFTCTTLGRVTSVCKDWQTAILTRYPNFPELSCIFSKQVIHVHPIMKFLLRIVGDCRNICYEERMSRVYIQRIIVELEKPSSEVQDILKNIKYSEYVKDPNFISMVQSLNGVKSSPCGDTLPFKMGIAPLLILRERLLDKFFQVEEAALRTLVNLLPLFGYFSVLLFLGFCVLLFVRNFGEQIYFAVLHEIDSLR